MICARRLPRDGNNTKRIHINDPNHRTVLLENQLEPERLQSMTVDDFLLRIKQNRPVVVTDAMREWTGLSAWTPSYLEQEFGTSIVQVYNDLFDLITVYPLSKYLHKYFNRSSTESNIPYVRWYTQLQAAAFCWADEAFKRIEHQWANPYFMPSTSFLLPFCMPPNQISPVQTGFPARGLFISGRGAQTRLHRDPWASDAVLFQLYGKKRWLMYSPGSNCKDSPTLEFTLGPGEGVFIPRDWLHHVFTLSDSISLTWNFVHKTTMDTFLDYLSREIGNDELKVLQFFFSKHLPATSRPSDIAAFIEANCG